MSLIGYGWVAGLFFGFLPLVVAVSSLTNLANLRKEVGFVNDFLNTFSFLASPLQAVLGSAALTIFMDFLPTFFNIIFAQYFQLRSDTYNQLRIQCYYFWFQIVFTVLVTAIGGSLVDTIQKVIHQPTILFHLLASSLPSATHFYLNFLVMQCFTQFMNLTRWFYLLKYLLFKLGYEEDDAKRLAEPEAQDYYGMGGRSARFAVNGSIAIIFGAISPIMVILAAANFLFCKMIYGYLIVFAEGIKPDLGGDFWNLKLEHTMKATLIYYLLMMGILFERSPDYGPGAAAVPAILVWIYIWQKFHHTLQWKNLPFEEVHESAQKPTQTQSV